VNRASPDAKAAEGQLRTAGDVFRSLWGRVSQGDIGSLPVLVGLLLIGVVFQLANPNFLTPVNLTNLMSQIAAVGTLSVGVTMVLLLGEIDLSVGAVSGFAAAIMAVLSVKSGLPGPLAVLLAILAGVLIGLFQGFWFARLHVPSFVVTLAGYLGWQGALLYVLGSTGTVNLTDPFIIGLANTRLPLALGWAVGIIFVLLDALLELRQRAQRAAAGLPVQSIGALIGRLALVAAALLIAVGIMSVNRNPVKGGIPIQGVPLGVLVLIAFIVILDLVTRRTPFGRHLFAVGGNAEAARRAGINVDRMRIAAFTLCSGLAACGGVLAGSRLLAVNQSSGSGDVLLNAIAAAVIGGTSLFGGRGSTWAALLGALVIGAIANGMDLLAFSSSVKFMVTGAVLLLAVTIDAYARSRRLQTGRS
jgi:D-xylose transport system permease protein